MPIKDPIKVKQLEHTPKIPTTSTKTPYSLKRPIEQDTNTSFSPDPLSKHFRPDNHPTNPEQQQTTTEVFRAGRRRKPPRRTITLLTTANNTQITRTHIHPNNYATHNQTPPLIHNLPTHEPSSPTKATTQTTSLLTHLTHLNTYTPPPAKKTQTPTSLPHVPSKTP
jgi:hypothetical protein